MKRDILPNHPKLQKAINALVASMLAIAGGLIVVCIIDWTDWKFAEPGEYETTLVTEILGTTFLVTLFFIFTAIIAIVLYIRFTKSTFTDTAQTVSPLLGAAKDHESQIIALLKSIAQPEPGTNKLNRANTIHFLRTLKEMQLFDSALDGQHQKAWVEQVTGYEEKSISAFNQALDKQKPNPKLVAEYRKQLEQILAE